MMHKKGKLAKGEADSLSKAIEKQKFSYSSDEHSVSHSASKKNDNLILFDKMASKKKSPLK